MIDARNIYRKVTRKIYDFSPEQESNILAIVWLYRGEMQRYLDLVAGYCHRTLEEATRCFEYQSDDGETIHSLPDFAVALTTLLEILQPFFNSSLPPGKEARAKIAETRKELNGSLLAFTSEVDKFRKDIAEQRVTGKKQKTTDGELKKSVDRLAPLAEASRDLTKQTDLLYKLAGALIETCEKECDVKNNSLWSSRDITRARKVADEARAQAVEQLKQVRYFWRQAHWLTERFPEAKLRDVEGLVKLVTHEDIEANDWSLTPGRYVGVAREVSDENFDFEDTLRNIHVELEDLNTEAVQLAATIKRNFEELGV